MHRGCGSNKRAGAAGWAGILFCPVKAFLPDLSALILRTVFSKLLKRQKLRTRIHRAASDKNGRNIDPHQADQITRDSLVTAGNIDSCIKRCGICLDLDHVCDHFPACKRIIDAIRPLTFPIAYIGTEIPGAMSACIPHPLAHLLHKSVQMPGTRVTVAKRAFNQYLRFAQILRRPSRPDPEWIKLRRKGSHFLTDQRFLIHHKPCLLTFIQYLLL